MNLPFFRHCGGSCLRPALADLPPLPSSPPLHELQASWRPWYPSGACRPSSYRPSASPAGPTRGGQGAARARQAATSHPTATSPWMSRPGAGTPYRPVPPGEPRPAPASASRCFHRAIISHPVCSAPPCSACRCRCRCRCPLCCRCTPSVRPWPRRSRAPGGDRCGEGGGGGG